MTPDQERLQELEIRYTLQQDLLDQLSDVIADHAKEISRLRALVEQLRARVPGEQTLAYDPDEKPPHY